MKETSFVWQKGTKPEEPMAQEWRERLAKERLSLKQEEMEMHTWPHELPLTPERQKMIAVVVAVFEEHFKRIGIPWKPEFPVERFHFFDREGFDAQFPEHAGNTGFHGKYDMIGIVEEGDSEKTLLNFFHEMVHSVSVQKYMLTENQEQLLLYRTGYEGVDTRDQDKGVDQKKTHLNAFNEGMAEMTALRMILRYKDILVKRLGFEKGFEERAAKNWAYGNCIQLLDLIITKLDARKGGKDGFDTWKKMERGQYTGEMMWMRDIDNEFGKGALRELDSFVAIPRDDVAVVAKNKEILKYFGWVDKPVKDKELQAEIY